jgi:hypothetical protein
MVNWLNNYYFIVFQFDIYNVIIECSVSQPGGREHLALGSRRSKIIKR